MTDPIHSDDDFSANRPNEAEHYSGALHEVSNALTVVLGWLEMAKKAGSLEEAQKALLVAMEHARRGQSMARRSIGADADSAQETRSASALVRFAATSVQPQAELRGVRVEAIFADSHDVRVEDDGKVLQILTNLLLNAIDFAPEDTTVTVSLARNGSLLSFLVQDEGPGVSEEIARGLFVARRTTREGGAGIGLPYSRKLAKDSGGDLRLVPKEEAQGTGACFELRWPATPTGRIEPSSPDAATAMLNGARILVIEDDASISSLVELSLEARGALVHSIADESQVDAVLSKNPVFDIALLDLSPIKDRLLEVLARIGSLAPGAPVVLMSGEPGGVPDIAEGKFAAWVRKPFDMEQLASTVGRLLL